MRSIMIVIREDLPSRFEELGQSRFGCRVAQAINPQSLEHDFLPQLIWENSGTGPALAQPEPKVSQLQGLPRLVSLPEPKIFRLTLGLP